MLLDGRLLVVTFAQTPAAGETNYANHEPASKVESVYNYDAGGRTNSVVTSFMDGSGSSTVLSNTCQYELTGISLGPTRGLKTASHLALRNSSGGTDTFDDGYTYDSGNDMLIGDSISDTVSGATTTSTESWSYDAAGNRNDAADVDNLNRVATLGGTHIEHDILGNRLFAGPANAHVADYTWDPLNRMLSYSAGGSTTSYSYRADGMRVRKTGQYATTAYRYDGQMGFEDVEVNNGVTTVTRSVLGARGVDSIIKGTGVSYPLYDAHGNMVATLAKTTNGVTVGNQRVLDPWGVVRQGTTTGDPSGRYCANLGHKQDDESGLVYMRARYYEPASGRFVSEDPGRNSYNSFSFCHNDPVNFADADGQIEFSLGDFRFRLDYDLRPEGDLHIYKKGVEVLSKWGSGAAHHVKDVDNVYTKEIIKTLGNAAKSGDVRAVALLKKMGEQPGHFGAPDKLMGRFGAAEDSVTATAEQAPDFLLEVLSDIGTFGVDP